MKQVKIGIDGGDNEPQKHVESGIQRLVSSFTAHVSVQTNFGIHYYYFSKNKKKVYGKHITYKRLPQKMFSHLFLPLRSFIDKIQIFLAFSGTTPPLIRLFSKSVVFIHDFGFYDYPQYYPTAEKLKWQTSYSILGASTIVVFSDYIRNQLLKNFPSVKKNKIVRIYPGADHILQFQNTKLLQIPDPFFLYVGVIKKIKNIETLLKLFCLYLDQSKNKKVKLIFIGKKEEIYWNSLIKSKQYIQYINNIIFLESVSDEELYCYYKNCIAVLNMSYTEGFCYPVIEALTLGKRVITNAIPLYAEFTPYFPGLYISKTEDEFVAAMNREATKKTTIYPVHKHPFGWNRFSKQLGNVIKKLTT